MNLQAGAASPSHGAGGSEALNEWEVSSCRNTSSSFSEVENIGDNVLSVRGPQIDTMYLQYVLGAVDGLEALADEVSPALHGNVTLGPFLSELLHLPDMFCMNAYGPAMNPEISAGMFEAVMGIAFRSGLESLLRAVVGIGVSIVLMIAWYNHRGLTVHQALEAISFSAYDRSMQYRSRMSFTMRNPLWVSLWSLVTEETIAKLLQKSFMDLFIVCP